MNDVQQMSAEAYSKLEAEINQLETVERAAIAAKIATAREDGDLKENAEYHAAKNDQSFLETRILQLRDQLDSAEIVEVTVSTSEIGFGSDVRLRDVATDKEVAYTIVSSYEQDASKGRLSASSPLAEALFGKGPGDAVRVRLPNGNERSFEVVDVS
jgi:transcription elongation factor GreA